MKGDFTRVTFEPTKHYSRVLKQQGRVTLEADDNEQAAILLHYIRTLARDLIGPYAAPTDGFLLGADDQNRLSIGAGHYYVDGLLVENEKPCLYTEQPDYRALAADDALAKEIDKPSGTLFWVYLDVWEHHITAIEDQAIREKALGGPDTCTRAKVVWQVKALLVIDALKALKTAAADADKADIDALQVFATTPVDGGDANPTWCMMPLSLLVSISKAGLGARVDPGKKTEDACVMPPDSRYRGAENQLYRVEIHDGSDTGKATFKWSRDNGSVATAWLGTAGYDLQVSHARGFEAGNWVELSDDTGELQGKPGVLVKLVKVQGDLLSVDPANTLKAWSKDLVNPKVRRWDQVQTEDTGAVAVDETPAGATETGFVWIDLEDGIQVRFTAGGEYRTGDYWLIPARVATGQIEWPDGLVQQPQGIEHHYAPLGFVWWKDGMHVTSCVCDIEPLGNCVSGKATKRLVRPKVIPRTPKRRQEDRVP